MDVLGKVLEVLHVGPDQHVSQHHELTVMLVLNCREREKVGGREWGEEGIFKKGRDRLTLHYTPRVEPPSHSLSVDFQQGGAGHHCKRDAFL